MKKNNTLWVAILGDREKVSTDRYFLTMTCFITSIFLFFLTIFNLLEHFKLAPVILAGSSCLLVLGIYFLLRFTKFLFYPKLMLTVIGLLFLDMTWYYKFLSNGPILFFILVFAALVLWVWEGKWLVIMLCFYFLNIAVLFVIEKNAPDFLFMYPASSLRSTDIYLGFSFYSILMITLLYTVKKQFERQKDKAIESDKLKTAFLGNMSHEIRTPMNHIVGFSELLENEEDKVKRGEYVKIIQNSGASLLKLINDLIDLSKIEAGDMTISNSNFSLNEMFDELKEIYSFELIRKGKYHVQLHYELPENDLIIYSDKLRLKQVLSNLLNNAMKFTDSGTITFGCFKEGHELNFSVADTGAGIPEKDQKKIFERFAKFDYKGMNPEGTGIGLSIVDKIVTSLNGRVWVKSVLGEGTSFFFSIPYNAPSALAIPFQRNIKKVDPIINITKRKLVLVVDDDHYSSLLIKEFLRPLDCVIECVTNGKDAIGFIKSNPETMLVLMDIQLPYMDGYEATSEIRKFNLKIPIIAQTANVMIGDREKAIAAGCNDYLSKPLDVYKLHEIVKFYSS